jgi:hypothetical protein
MASAKPEVLRSHAVGKTPDSYSVHQMTKNIKKDVTFACRNFVAILKQQKSIENYPGALLRENFKPLMTVNYGRPTHPSSHLSGKLKAQIKLTWPLLYDVSQRSATQDNQLKSSQQRDANFSSADLIKTLTVLMVYWWLNSIW